MDMSLSELRELVMDRETWGTGIHGVAKSRTWLSNWTEYCITYMYHNFIHSSVDGHLGCFNIVAIVNGTAMNMCLFALWVSQGICPVVGLLGHQFSWVSQLCLTFCDSMDCSTPCFPVHRHLLEFAEIHVHRVSDTIQASHPLLSPSSPAFDLSQHLF